MAAPPFEDGAVKATESCALPAVMPVIVGAVGTIEVMFAASVG